MLATAAWNLPKSKKKITHKKIAKPPPAPISVPSSLIYMTTPPIKKVDSKAAAVAMKKVIIPAWKGVGSGSLKTIIAKKIVIPPPIM